MIQKLALAFTVAGCLLMMVGERFGIPADAMMPAAMAILAAALSVTALASATSRLVSFVRGAEIEHPAGLFVTTIIGLGAAMAAADAIPGAKPPGGTSVWLVPAGFCVGALLGVSEEPAHRGHRAILRLLRGLVALGVLALLWAPLNVAALPFVAAMPVSLSTFVVVLVLVPFVLGGGPALRRGATVLVAMAALFLILPFLIEAARLAPDIWDSAKLAQQLWETTSIPGADLFSRAPLPALTVAAIGLGAGLVISSGWQGERGGGRPKRLGVLPALLAGVVAVLAAALASFALQMAGQALGAEILRLPPGQWPDFVFSDPVRGWVRLCDVAPARVDQALSACPPGATRSVIVDGYAAPALAAARSWPTMIGVLWSLCGLGLLLGGAGLLFHRLAVDWARLVFVDILHPRGLRAWQLAMIRLTALCAIVALALYPPVALPPLEPLLPGFLGAIILLAALSALGGKRGHAAPGARGAKPVEAEG